MSEQMIIRAWKDASYRQSLSADEQAFLPAHPAGAIELHAGDLELTSAAADPGKGFVSLGYPPCPCSMALKGR